MTIEEETIIKQLRKEIAILEEALSMCTDDIGKYNVLLRLLDTDFKKHYIELATKKLFDSEVNNDNGY